MESNKRNFLLFLLLTLLCVCTVRMCNYEECPSSPDADLTCYNDYNRNITCVWNSAHEYTDAHCTLNAKGTINPSIPNSRGYNASCALEPVDDRSVQKKCSLYFNRDSRFMCFQTVTITLSCNKVKTILTIPYRPFCHIKLDPPGKPVINFTTVSWQIRPKSRKLNSFASELQWKKWDQSWNDPKVETKPKQGDLCDAQLEPNLLIQGETYQARIRVKTTNFNLEYATWSDWGPTVSWVSRVGEPKPLPSGVFGGVLGVSITGAVFALCLAVKLLRNEKVSWVYNKITGSPIPNPNKSFLNKANFQSWMSPHFASELSHSSLIRGEIVSVEVTSTVDAVTPWKKDVAMLEKMKSENSYESTNSSFSNPSYSHLCASPPVSSLAIDKLQPCPAVGSQGDGKTAEEVKEDESKKKLEIQQLLSKENNKHSEPVQVVSDYERVERPPVENFDLQSPDLDMCRGEEASQESLEARNTCVMDEESGGKEQEREERTEKVDFKKLFGDSGNVFGKGSIQVCSDYEKIPMLNPGSPELSSVDSGVCSGGEEQASHEEIQEDFDKSSESTRFQFPPLQSPSPSHIKEMIAPITMSRSMEPSDDGYMPP